MPRNARSYQQEAERLRASGWTYRQIAADWKQRYGLNSRVAFRLAHGFTQAEVAHRWNQLWPDADTPKTAKHISYWEIWPSPAGRAPSVDTLNKLAFLYQCAAGDLLDGEDFSHLDPGGHLAQDQTASAAGSSDAAEPSFTALGDNITKVTAAVVEDFELLTDTYRHLDYREGSHRVSADVTAHLRRMLDVSTRTINRGLHQRLLRAVGDAAQLAGWLAIDRQHYGQAMKYCNLAVSIADKTNDRGFQAYALGLISYIYLHSGDGRAALSVLTSARDLTGRGVPSAVSSWIREATGEAYALLGQARPGLTALAESERAFDGVNADNTPGWLTFYNADCHAARLKGRCLVRLGRPREATRALYEALTLLPQTFVRERSGTLIDLASAYLQTHQIEQACDAGIRADQLARRTGSERNRKRLRGLLVDLMPWTNQDCVQQLYRQVLLN